MDGVYSRIRRPVRPYAALRAAVFLDRDGWITEDTHYLHRAEGVRFIPGAPEAVADINQLGFPVVLVTNQAGIGRGHYDLPAFTGLGSSSSFAVALLQALHAYCGRYRNGMDLAYEAIHLERHAFCDSVGCQDQVFAAVGGFNLIEFRAEDDIQVYRVPISPQRLSQLRDQLMICFTGIRRSASEVAAKQIRKISNNRSALLRMRRLVDEGYDVLVSDRNLSRFGELLHENWMCKRSLHEEVSSGAIDQLYDRAMSAGALGGNSWARATAASCCCLCLLRRSPVCDRRWEIRWN